MSISTSMDTSVVIQNKNLDKLLYASFIKSKMNKNFVKNTNIQ